jgi:hypothetical protein
MSTEANRLESRASARALGRAGRAVGVLGALLGAPCAAAQVPTEVTFSVDWQGPLMGVPNSTSGVPITEADLLYQPGNFFSSQPPGLRITPSFLARYSQCLGHLPGVSCGIELDALSFGVDARLRTLAGYEFDVLFSVDEHAIGGSTLFTPSVSSEAAVGDAAADIFMRRLMGAGPFGPVPGWNLGVIDGNGRRGASGALYPGLGLREPTVSSPTLPDLGDNLDGFDLGPAPLPGARLYFSLDGGLPDIFEPGANVANSAALQPDPTGVGFTGADILVVDVQGIVLRYASGQELGLGVSGMNDIDALVVVENGFAGYQPSLMPYDWLPGATPAPRDLVLFSVRRGSAVIGQIDSLLGLPITEGDVLGAPIGGTAGARPSIFIAAEVLGLQTQRGMFVTAGDELNALDVRDNSEDPINDCNNNGIEDAYDIANGTSPDDDGNGIPDECEDPGSDFCDCDSALEAPCGNTANAGEGCRNNTGQGGRLAGSGTSSIATDSLVLDGTQVTPNTFAIVFFGAGTASVVPPQSNGRLCVVGGGGSSLYRIALEPTGTGGAFTYGPGILADVAGLSPPPTVMAGSTWGFQAWYRDNGGPCGGASNLTNGWRTTFTP